VKFGKITSEMRGIKPVRLLFQDAKHLKMIEGNILLHRPES